MKAMLVLEDGSSFEGISAGADGEAAGEVVMNTSVVGYQEIMTDPANAGKIMVFTYPLIGNYGVAGKFNESRKCWLEAVVMKEKSRIRSNWQSEDTFDGFLKKENIAAMDEVDTRTLAVRIRESGEMRGIISTRETRRDKLLKKLAETQNNGKRDYIKNISVRKITELPADKPSARIGVLDLGMLNSFLRQLKTLSCSVVLLPYNTEPEEILKMRLNGLIISSGPEADDSMPKITATAGKLDRKSVV
jgi:carbamoyl-phosphate synthase small subunit